MAAVLPAKRPRALTDGVDSLGGVNQNSRNKRPRNSELQNSDQSSGDERSDASGSDASEHEDEHAVEHEQWATQQVQKERRATANMRNVANDSGIIEEIQCFNFMCHEHLTVTLGPLINFIIGHNGSGKSAVLTALTICLGGKATATNRAQNLKSLIKEGKDYASVTVRIKNQGPLAYKPQDYGDSIIVERHFSRSNSSGFKLKDMNGKIVTTRKAELEDILDAFSMQIDNPMNVLTQDMARQFLNHSTPKEKYKFFLQGTQLESLNRDYQQIEQSLDVMSTKVEHKEEDLKELRRRMEDFEKKARRAQHFEHMRAKEKVLANQAAWANVQEAEAELEDALHHIRDLDVKIQEREQEVSEASARYEQADQAHDAAQQQVTDIAAEIDPAKQEELDADAAWKEVKGRLLQLTTDQRHAQGVVSAKQSEVNKCNKEIEQLRRRQAEAENGLYAEKVRELDEAKADHSAATQAYEAHNEGLPQLREELQAAQKEQQMAEQKVNKASADERRIKSKIETLKGGQRNWIDGYKNRRELESLLRAIASEPQFRERPVGPMGRHIKLLEPQWGHILEKQFGQALDAFVVTSKQDFNTLSGLMKKHRWIAPVYIGNREPIRTENNEPDRELLTWMRALKFEDHLVRNQCIIHQGIEQTVLIEDMKEGERFMYARGAPTKNVKMCFTFADGNRQKGRTINFTSNGGVNNSPIGEFRGDLRMQVALEDQIKEEQARLAQVQQELRDHLEFSRQLQGELNACKSREADHQSQKKALQLAYQRASRKVDQLEGELSDATPDAAAIEVLEEQLTNLKEESERTKGQFEDMVASKMELDQESRTKKQALETAQKARQDLDFKLNKAHSTVRKLQNTREEGLKRKNDAISKVDQAQVVRTEWVTRQEECQKELDTAIEGARGVCPERVPVPEGKSSHDLADTWTKLVETRKKTEKELGGSQDELLRQANEAKRMHKDAMQEFQDITNLRNQLTVTLNNRRTRWKQFRSGISVRARVTFNYLLSERKFRGNLMIDHDKQLLDIHVQPDIMERSGDGRQTKTLSGGEKSYSTVCLLLSLWDAMGSPIRCLDEFDVFMDSVNRERSMLMIIEAAQRSIGRQFIFITPQSMNNVNQTAEVKIIKMTDPERGQTALPVRRS